MVSTEPTLLELATAKFGRLSKAQEAALEKLFDKVIRGDVADYRDPNDDKNDLAGAAAWGAERVLLASHVAWLCTDPAAAARITHWGLSIRGARIEGEFDLSFARLTFPIGLVRCAILDGLDLHSATIPALYLNGTWTGPLNADGIQIRGDLFLRDGFTAQGDVLLLGAKIGATLDCGGGHFHNKGNIALNADRAEVSGSVFLNEGFTANGAVRLPGAKIGGVLSCIDGHFHSEGKTALHADGAEVSGSVFFRDSLDVRGQASSVEVRGRVSFVGARIHRHFIWKDVQHKGLTLDLRSARIGTLWHDDNPGSWPDGGKLLLHGLVYDELADDAPMDAESRLKWLRRQPHKPFRPQPYQQLAKVLREGGRENDATNVLIAMERDRARWGQIKWYQWGWYYFFGPIIRYGYQPWWAFWIGVVLIVLGSFVFSNYSEHIMQTKAKAFTPASTPREQRPAGDYPVFNSVVYSIDVFVPLVDLHQVSYWLPNAASGEVWIDGRWGQLRTGGIILIWFWFQIAAGWVLTTLLVVSLTGLVRK